MPTGSNVDTIIYTAVSQRENIIIRRKNNTLYTLDTARWKTNCECYLFLVTTLMITKQVSQPDRQHSFRNNDIKT